MNYGLKTVWVWTSVYGSHQRWFQTFLEVWNWTDFRVPKTILWGKSNIRDSVHSARRDAFTVNIIQINVGILIIIHWDILDDCSFKTEEYSDLGKVICCPLRHSNGRIPTADKARGFKSVKPSRSLCFNWQVNPILWHHRNVRDKWNCKFSRG